VISAVATSARYWCAAAVLAAAYVALVLVVAAGWTRPLDRAIGAAAYAEQPCWLLTAGQAASPLLAGELSLVYAGALALFCAWRGRPLAGLAVVGLLLATVPVELLFKSLFEQPPPRAALGGLSRPDCFAVGYPLTSVPTPSSLPSGYAIRAAYFGLLLAALVGARRRRLATPVALVLLLAVLLLAASRVTIAWHWTSDVLAGLLLGAAYACAALALAGGFRWLHPPSIPLGQEGRGLTISRRGLSAKKT
jgi:undecaprenyl-diphosphatase